MRSAWFLLLSLALAPSQASAWMSRAASGTSAPPPAVERMNGWVTLKGPNNKTFYARAADLDKFQETKEAGGAELFEGDIPAASWWPSWTAIKNLALWRTEATLQRSAYRLEAKYEDWRVVFDAVKGEERHRLFEAERGGRLTVASIAFTGTSAAAPPAQQEGAAAPPPRLTEPAALATGSSGRRETRSEDGSAPKPPPDLYPAAAAALLFPNESATQRLLTAVLRDAETTDPGVTQEFVEQVSAVKDDPAKLQGVRALWAENLNDFCGPAPMGNAALEQAKAMAGSGAATADSAEGAAAAAGVDGRPRELQGLCRERAMAPVDADPSEDLRRAQESLTMSLAQPVRLREEPPSPSTEGASNDGPSSSNRGKGGGAMKFLAALMGAAIFAVVGSVLGPAAGLAFAGIGGLIGLKSAPKPAKMPG